MWWHAVFTGSLLKESKRKIQAARAVKKLRGPLRDMYCPLCPRPEEFREFLNHIYGFKENVVTQQTPQSEVPRTVNQPQDDWQFSNVRCPPCPSPEELRIYLGRTAVATKLVSK